MWGKRERERERWRGVRGEENRDMGSVLDRRKLEREQ